MDNNSETNKPPKPVWGNEITIPSESENLNSEDNYSLPIDNVDEPSVSNLPSGKLNFFKLQFTYEAHLILHHTNKKGIILDPSTCLTPTEEYLEMTKRLIQSKSLPSHTTKKLKTLYAIYKSSNGYGTATLVETKITDHEQKALTTSSKSTETNKTKKLKHSKKDTTAGDKISLPDRAETRSISQDSDQSESLSMQMYMTEQYDEEENNRSSKASMGNFAIPWYGVHDFMFGRPCDPDLIKIDDAFPDFTLQDAGYDQHLKMEIRKWLDNRSLVSSTSSTVRRAAKEAYAELEAKLKDSEGSQSTSNGSPK